jgi:hypothetical protein
VRWPTPPNRTVERMNWHRWFAWHPVDLPDGDRVWWEVVERKGEYHYDSCGGSWTYEYRDSPARTGV